MVSFNFSYDPGTSLQQMVGFETAGRVWSNYLTDNITLNIHVGVASSLPTNVIGGALPGIQANQSYDLVQKQLQADVSSLDDQIAVDNLAPKKDFKASFDLYDKNKNSGSEATTKTVNVTRANAKALNISIGGSATALDGVILLGSLGSRGISWNYDATRTGSAIANSLDFISVAVHEIGHILGFVSGVDKPGWLASTAADKPSQESYKKSLADRITYATPLDFFRFSDRNTKGLNDLSYGATGGEKFFSIDGGNTPLAYFSSGTDARLGGDGSQASHWQNQANALGIMDPTLTLGERAAITKLDLLSFDVMGWNVKSNANLNLDLSALQSQSEQAVAQRVGQTVAWLKTNYTTSVQSLTRDRSQDIQTMIDHSQIYNWGSKGGSGSGNSSGNGNGNGNGNPLHQVLDLLSSETIYSSFDTLEDLLPTTISTTFNLADKSSETPPRAMSGNDLPPFAALNALTTMVNFETGISLTVAPKVVMTEVMAAQPLNLTINLPPTRPSADRNFRHWGSTQPSDLAAPAQTSSTPSDEFSIKSELSTRSA